MIIKYNLNIDDKVLQKDVQRITNLIFKLLPRREEGKEWKTTLQNLILELVGFKELIQRYQEDFIVLLSKLEALMTLKGEDDFLIFRRGIFESLNILSRIQRYLKGANDELSR